MFRKKKQYVRLSKRSFSILGIHSLWKGPDHLLWVETLFGKEYYKRFFFKDIQSIVMMRTSTHIVWAFVWGIPTFIFGLLALAGVGSVYFSSITAALFLVALLSNGVMGPSCTVYLQTAVQMQKLTSFTRLRFARKVMNKIKAHIEEAQGPFQNQHTSNSAIAAGHIDPITLKPGTLNASPVTHSPDISQSAFNPLLHQLFFGFLFLSGFVVATQLVVKSLVLGLLMLLLHSSLQVMVVVCLTRWHRHIKASLIAKINWLSLIFITFQSVIIYALFIVASIDNPMINYNHWEMFKLMLQLQQTNHPLALTGNLVYIGGCVILGICGSIQIQRYRAGRIPNKEKA